MSVNPLNMLRPSNPSQRGGKKYGCLSKAQEKKGFKGRREPQLDTPLGSPASVYGSPLMHATGAAQNGAEKKSSKKVRRPTTTSCTGWAMPHTHSLPFAAPDFLGSVAISAWPYLRSDLLFLVFARLCKALQSFGYDNLT